MLFERTKTPAEQGQILKDYIASSLILMSQENSQVQRQDWVCKCFCSG